MTSDWRTMSPGKELDRAIAEKMGYKAVLWNGFYHVTANPEKFAAWATRRGRDVNLIGKSSESAAWEFCNNIPAYSTSVDAALTLLRDTQHYILGWHREGVPFGDPGDIAFCNLFVDRNDVEPDKRGNYPAVAHQKAATHALAICRAWLEWQEKIEAMHHE